MSQAVLGLWREWVVEKIDFNINEKRLDIYLNFKLGIKFKCPE